MSSKSLWSALFIHKSQSLVARMKQSSQSFSSVNNSHACRESLSLLATPSLPDWSASIFAFLLTWTNLIVLRVCKWEWIQWKTYNNFQCFDTLSGEVPLWIFLLALTIKSESAPMITFCKFASTGISKHLSNARSSAMLFVPFSKWPWKIYFVCPEDLL